MVPAKYCHLVDVTVVWIAGFLVGEQVAELIAMTVCAVCSGC